jgi:hypothetical protein
MKKAKAKRRTKLPLDDSNWLPVLDAHKAILPRTGNWHLAARDLTAAMAKADGVRSMRRRVMRGEGPDRKLLPRSFWNTYELRPWNSRPGPFPIDTLLICPPGKIGRAIEGYAFFVWKPDLEKIWPTAAPTTTMQAREGQSKPGSADAWIDHICPNGEWRLMTAKDIHKKILPEAKALGVKAPSYSAVAAALLKRPT